MAIDGYSICFLYICNMLEKIVNQYIERKQLAVKTDKVLVALSGGADSVALLRVLCASGYLCVAAHCNFHLRGEESDRDEAFVRNLCAHLKVPLEVVHFDTKGYAEVHKCSIEMAARELRYDWFEAMRVKYKAQVVAVAHHKDDSVETFLLNLIRGAGIKGLRGIAAVNGHIIRPLLEVSRTEILEYLSALKQEYVTDSTNLETEFTRNKIRLQVLPLLKDINPSICDTIYETTLRLSDTDVIYRQAIKEAVERVRLSDNEYSISALLNEAAPSTLLFEILNPCGFNASQIDDLLECMVNGHSGKLFYAGGYVLLRDRDTLVLRVDNKEDAGGWVLSHKVLERTDAQIDFSNPNTVYLDADTIKGELTLRLWESGDRFMPFGMRGFKKVRDYLRDRKLSLFQKEHQYVVCDEEKILWLVGERTDQRSCISSSTIRVLVLSVGCQ